MSLFWAEGAMVEFVLWGPGGFLGWGDAEEFAFGGVCDVEDFYV